jgi:hypothetical protein
METIKPVRLQRERVKGFRLESPNGLSIVYVGRPTKWGNPFEVGRFFTSELPNPNHLLEIIDKSHASDLFTWFMEGMSLFGYYGYYPSKHEIKKELKGKNLACWCKEGEPCHADILLKIANEE